MLAFHVHGAERTAWREKQRGGEARGDIIRGIGNSGREYLAS